MTKTEYVPQLPVVRRNLLEPIQNDLKSKIVLLSGPRQTGKTTLSKSVSSDYEYLSYDISEDRLRMIHKEWNANVDLLIFDELHKMQNWKRWLKGLFDKHGVSPKMLVTGSARLDIAKKMGDSLAGRFFSYRLFPFDPYELKNEMPSKEAMKRILSVGGFPEPFLNNSEAFYGKWRKSHLDIILRQDLLDLENVRNITSVETLLEILRTCVGSTVSYASIGRQLEKDANTVKRWLTMLENLFVIFRVTPYSKSISRSILKEPKFYFYDVGQVRGDMGQKLENAVAVSLKKRLCLYEDTQGGIGNLHYVKNRDRKEVDFLVSIGQSPKLLVEVKWKDPIPTENFNIFQKDMKNVSCIQLVSELEKTYKNQYHHETHEASKWLASDWLEKCMD